MAVACGAAEVVAEGQTTNCVVVRQPEGANCCTDRAVGLLALRRELESLGEIARACQGRGQTLQVVYYDVRSAMRAKERFGEQLSFGPAEGCRTVTFARSTIDAAALAGFASRIASDGEDRIEAEFFDTRVAAYFAGLQAAAALAAPAGPTASEAAPAEGDEADGGAGPASPRGSASEASEAGSGWRPPALVLDSLLPAEGAGPGGAPDACEDALASAREPRAVALPGLPRGAVPRDAAAEPAKVATGVLRTAALGCGPAAWRAERRAELQLRGLPSALCRAGALEALAAAHGLAPFVASVHAASSGAMGTAVIEAVSAEGARRIAKFFHGRQFARSSLPVAVSFAVERPGRRLRLRGLGDAARPVKVHLAAPPPLPAKDDRAADDDAASTASGTSARSGASSPASEGGESVMPRPFLPQMLPFVALPGH